MNREENEHNHEHQHEHKHLRQIVNRLARIEGHVRSVKEMALGIGTSSLIAKNAGAGNLEKSDVSWESTYDEQGVNPLQTEHYKNPPDSQGSL